MENPDMKWMILGVAPWLRKPHIILDGKIDDNLAISGIAIDSIDHPIYREVTGVQSQMHEATKNDCIVLFSWARCIGWRKGCWVVHLISFQSMPKLGDLIFLAKNHWRSENKTWIQQSLSGGWPTPLKNISQLGWLFQTTNQIKYLYRENQDPSSQPPQIHPPCTSDLV